jgi:hypothetical protein
VAANSVVPNTFVSRCGEELAEPVTMSFTTKVGALILMSESLTS